MILDRLMVPGIIRTSGIPSISGIQRILRIPRILEIPRKIRKPKAIRDIKHIRDIVMPVVTAYFRQWGMGGDINTFALGRRILVPASVFYGYGLFLDVFL